MQEKFWGKVIHGLGKGKNFGFATINIQMIDSTLHINKGVYAALVTIHNQTFKGMLYVGTRPTFELQKMSIEIHILDFKEDIYNQQIFFQILHKIREEIKFNNEDQLIKQLHQDKKMVYNYFQNNHTPFSF